MGNTATPKWQLFVVVTAAVFTSASFLYDLVRGDGVNYLQGFLALAFSFAAVNTWRGKGCGAGCTCASCAGSAS